MGIDYKEHQKSTNHVVALKMLPWGDHARPETLGRFRQEAEPPARRHHPHVVQVYEAGVADGRCYLTMEFVDGPNLAHRCGRDGAPDGLLQWLVDGFKSLERRRCGLMHTVRMRRKTGADGCLELIVPIGMAETECEVVVVVQPQRPEGCGWLPYFFERMAQGWQGERLERPPQGEYEVRELLR